MKRGALLLCLLAALALAACAAPEVERTETEGRLLLAEDGTALLVTGDGTPMVLSLQAEGDDPWAGYHSGDRLRVTHDGVEETYPLRTGACDWERLEEGDLSDVPEETLTKLEGLGWDFGRDIVHEPAAEPQTVEDPVSGYCGNTVTEVTLDGETFSFWGSDSVALTDLVINLDYADGVCRCMPEFTVDTEFGDGYGVNLTNSYVRHEGRQAPLTAEQAETIREVIERNCK